MVRHANRQEENQQRERHHFGHQYTIWKTEDVDASTGQRVLKQLEPSRWRQTDDGSWQAVFDRPEDGTERERRAVWTRLTRLLYNQSRAEPYGGDDGDAADVRRRCASSALPVRTTPAGSRPCLWG